MRKQLNGNEKPTTIILLAARIFHDVYECAKENEKDRPEQMTTVNYINRK